MSSAFRRTFIFLLSALILIKAPVWACVPNFPIRLLTGGDKIVLEAPDAIFQNEIDRIRLTDAPAFKAIILSIPNEIIKIEKIELSEALKSRNVAGSQIDRIVSKYLSFRKTLLNPGLRSSLIKEKQLNQNITSPLQLNLQVSIEGLPQEFAHYLKGAVFYYQEQSNKAINAWKKILKLSRHERFYRATWAAFMVGKVLLVEDPAQAIPWFKRVRQLVKQGYADSLGLAASSLGWEARAFLDQHKYNQAIELYAKQFATGDHTAIQSLRIAARRALKTQPTVLKEIASNTLSRKFLTALVVSYHKSLSIYADPPLNITRKWLAAVEAAETPVVQDADRLAWAAYQIGEFELAKHWLEVAPENSALTWFIRAKLLLRKGNLSEAIKQLEYIKQQLHPAQKVCKLTKWYLVTKSNIAKRIQGELGVLFLSQQQFVKSLDALLKGGFWEDAAYVAERILSSNELKEYAISIGRQTDRKIQQKYPLIP